MKICVCSDSHGNWKALQEVLDRERPEAFFFLGDGERDLNRLVVPQETMVFAVCGNCDLASALPSTQRVELEGKRIFATHGHYYGVKYNLYKLEDYVVETPTDLVLYGHTHHAQLDNDGVCLYLCPGSMEYNEERYAVVTLKKGERIDVSFRRL